MEFIIKRLLKGGKVERLKAEPEDLDKETQCWQLEEIVYQKTINCVMLVMTDNRTSGHKEM